jgi:restriction endonuclease Mrr
MAYLIAYQQAAHFVEPIECRNVVLINPDQFADFLIDPAAGVVTTKTYEIRAVSNGFFDESQG